MKILKKGTSGAHFLNILTDVLHYGVMQERGRWGSPKREAQVTPRMLLSAVSSREMGVYVNTSRLNYIKRLEKEIVNAYNE